MIVRDLLIKLGFQANTGGADKVEGKIDRIKQRSQAASVAVGQFAAQLAMMGLQKAASEMQQASDASIEFGRSMANISALMGGNEKRTLELAQAAKDLGKEFGMLPKDVSAAMYEVMGSLGDSKETIGQVRQSMLLGKSGAASAAEGFALLGVVTRTYGDTSEAAMKHTADLAAATVRMGKVSLPELSAALPQVTSLARTLGVSMEDLFTPFATFTGTLGSGAEVATKFDSALTAMIKKTPQMEKAWKHVFGKDKDRSAKAVLGKYGVQGTLTKLVESAHGDMDKLADMFGRKEGLQFALAMTGEQAGEYASKVSGDMRNVTGEVDRAVKAQTSGMGKVAFAMDQARAAAAAQRIELGDRLSPAFVQIEVIGGKIAKLFGDDIIPLFEGASAAGGTFGLSLENIEPIMKLVQISIAGVAFVLDQLLTQIKMVITGVATTAAMARAAASGNWSGVKEAALAGSKDVEQQVLDLYTRQKNRGALVLGIETSEVAAKKFQQRSQQARDSQLAMRDRFSGAASAAAGFLGGGPIGGGLGKIASLINNVGGVTIHVSVPAGTEAAAAARVGDQMFRAAMGGLLDGVTRGNPVQESSSGGGLSFNDWAQAGGA